MVLPMQDIHFSHGLLAGNSLAQPADDRQISHTLAQALRGKERMLKITWGPDIGGSEERELDPRRQHADDVVRRTVKRDRLVQNIWIAAEAAMPQRVTDHDDGLAGGLSFFRQEEAAQLRRDAE